MYFQYYLNYSENNLCIRNLALNVQIFTCEQIYQKKEKRKIQMFINRTK